MNHQLHTKDMKHSSQHGHGTDRRNIKSTAPWAMVAYQAKDGTIHKKRCRVYLHCRQGEMMIDKKGNRRFFTGKQADSRLSYVLL